MRLPDGVRRYLLDLLERDAAERALDTAELQALATAAEGCSAKPLPELLRGWVSSATAQMRWKRARPVAAKELADHLSDQYEAFLDEGMDEDTAAQATVREMGDAVEIGTQLDRTWRPRPDWVMLGIVLVVAAAGLVLQYSMRSNNDLEWYMFFGKYVAGAVCLLAAYFVDYTILGRRCWLLYGLWVAGGLLLTFGPFRVESMGKLVYLAQWVWFFPVLFAGILFRQRGKGTRGVCICLLSLPAMWFLAMHAPSMAAIAVQTVVCCGILFMAVWRGAFGRRSKGKLLLAVLPLLFAAVYVAFLLLFDAGVRDAFYIAFDPSVGPQGEGYWGQLVRQMMFGSPEGQGNGLMFMQWNDATTDWLFMTTKWTWGWPGAAFLIGAEALLLLWGFRIARKQTGLLARSVCMGVMVTFALQTLMYVLQNCGIILIDSYGLPLLSYGGIYLCQTMLLLGLLLSAQRSGQLESGLAPQNARSIP
ncbi:permease prefix domain 1-containing protein [uncultured Agathobaculum sp.]|uniref:permease prefix domain 1-containing protein n=1 Tax=uncultured Agathobaculum sp. TaxID=2048140 RepID=UPI0032085CDF